MKYLIMALLLLTAASSNLNAADGKPLVTSAAHKAFERSFKNASEVSWTEANNVYKVEFLFNSQYNIAYYNASGALITLEKNIVSTQLPLILEANLKTRYAGFWITSLQEFSNDKKVSYTIKLENAFSKLVLRSSGTGWILVQKTLK